MISCFIFFLFAQFYEKKIVFCNWMELLTVLFLGFYYISSWWEIFFLSWEINVCICQADFLRSIKQMEKCCWILDFWLDKVGLLPPQLKVLTNILPFWQCFTTKGILETWRRPKTKIYSDLTRPDDEKRPFNVSPWRKNNRAFDTLKASTSTVPHVSSSYFTELALFWFLSFSLNFVASADFSVIKNRAIFRKQKQLNGISK